MSGYGPNLALVFVLIIINALFAGSEMALVSLREGQLKQLERRTDQRAQRLVRLARDPNRFLATIQIGITLAGFLASATAAVKLAEPLRPYLKFLGGAAEGVAIGGVTVLLTFVTLVFGELAPKRIAMQRALPWALAVARPLDVLASLARPAVFLLGATSNLVVRLAGGRTIDQDQTISPDELHEIVSSHTGLDPEQRLMISGALEIRDRRLRDIVLPRGAVFSLRADLTIDQARVLLADAGHSRAPVTRTGHLDDVIGVVHWASLSPASPEPLSSVTGPALVLPETLGVLDAIATFRRERQQLAIVIDEHGATDGIVTLEDLVEEVVGEIYDELDPQLTEVVRDADGSVLVPGTFPLHDLPDVGIRLTDESAPRGYATVAGLVLDRLGRIPDAPGDELTIAPYAVRVEAVAGRAVRAVRFRLIGEDDAAELLSAE